MARVRLRIDDFEDGVLPEACVSSGRPTTAQYHVAAHRQPWWPLWFVLLGPVGLVLAAAVSAALHQRVPGFLPFDDEVQAVGRAQRRNRTAAMVVAAVATGGVVLVAGGAGYGQTALVAFLAGAVITGLLWFAAARPRGAVGLRLERDGRWVRVDDASPVFVAAYEAQEAARRERRRRDLVD